MFNLRFEQPALLFVALLALPLLWLGLRTLAHVEPVRRWTILTLRTLLIVLIAGMLAGPHAVQEHDHLTVVALVDVSGSVRRFADLPTPPDAAGRTNINALRYWLTGAVERRPGDRFGIVAFDGQAIVATAPTRGTWLADNIDLPMRDGTNVADAIRLGLATLPGDTAARLVLMTDGNQTLGDALEAARQAVAAGGTSRRVPIDVLPISYRIENDVQITRVEAPPNAQPGQTITVRIIMESAAGATGNLTLRREGEPVDLSPSQPGHTRRINVPPGQSVHLAQVTLGQTPINRFQAVFEPDDPEQDVLVENNRAEAFTATPSRGSVLVLQATGTSVGTADTHALGRMLGAAELPVTVQSAQSLPHDLLSLQNYDLIVLDNVPAYDLTSDQQQLLAHYVDRLGGGLLKIGGEQSFGAGGWMRTPLAQVLPLELDPPRELRVPSAALVLVLDRSGSMNRPVGGARASQQEVANEAASLAVESLHSDTYIGVVAFDHMPERLVPLRLNDDPDEIIDVITTIQPMGGTRIEPALRLAHEMLRGLPEVPNRHILLLTDGLSQDPGIDEFIATAASDKVKVTTIGIGDHIDDAQLQRVAEGTGSVFHHVRNPRLLPRVLVDTVQEFNKPLIKEGEFRPMTRPTGSALAVGMDEAPPLRGIVITAPRADRTVMLEMVHPDGEPLLAHWQAGLGRVAAFTSDLDGPWSRAWADWPGAQAFWTQLVRTIARPSVSRETEMITIIEDDRLHITLEAAGGAAIDADDEAGDAQTATARSRFMNYLTVEGTVYLPSGETQTVRLRQTAPGRYEADIAATEAGSYIVALSPRQGARQLAPVIGGASRATSDEFRRLESDVALLREIAQTTGGRILSVDSPAEAQLFDRSGMPRSASLLPAWRSILWWVILLLLLDVAARRLAWDWPLVKRGLLAAIAQVAPSRVKGERALATLGGLQDVTARAEVQRQRQQQGVQPLKGSGEMVPPRARVADAADVPEPRREDTSARSKKPSVEPAMPKKSAPDPDRVSSALDALLGRSGRKEQEKPAAASPKSSSSSPTTQPPKPEDEQSSPTRSSLLAAKRRAREQLDRDKP